MQIDGNNAQKKPSKKLLQFMNDYVFNEKYDGVEEISNFIKPEHLDYFIQGGYTELNYQTQIIPQSENQWIIKKEWEYEYLITIENFAGRLKITMKEQDDQIPISKTYSCSWSFNEIVAKNPSLNCFQDIDCLIDILKSIIVNPKNFSFRVEYSSTEQVEENSSIILKFDVFSNQTSLEFNLLYLEKEQSEKEKEEKEFENLISNKCMDMEDNLYDLFIKMNDLLAKNGLKGKNVFPEEMKKQCEERWKKKHPHEQLPNYPLETYEQINDLNSIEILGLRANIINDPVGGN